MMDPRTAIPSVPLIPGRHTPRTAVFTVNGASPDEHGNVDVISAEAQAAIADVPPLPDRPLTIDEMDVQTKKLTRAVKALGGK